jgi:hypothetical protein
MIVLWFMLAIALLAYGLYVGASFVERFDAKMSKKGSTLFFFSTGAARSFVTKTTN